MALIPIPVELDAEVARFEQVAAVSYADNPFTFARDIVDHGGRQWRCDMVIVPLEPADADVVDAFLRNLRSGVNTVEFSGATFNMPSGPAAALPWRLSFDSRASLPRRQGRLSDRHSVTWLEVRS